MSTVILIVLLSPPVIVIGFIVAMTVQKLIDSGIWCPWWIKAIAYLLIPIAYPADAIMNLIFGWAIFREAPWKWRGLMFSSRVQYHRRHSTSGKRYPIALRWTALLNFIGPGHIKE